MSVKKLSHFIIIILFLLVLGLLFFGWQIDLYLKKSQDLNTNFDSIIIFTGEKYRIKKGLELSKKYKVPLLISGINRKYKNLINTQINSHHSNYTLGSIATDTRLNGVETDLWLTINNLNKPLLITSYYHMPRSRLAVKRYGYEVRCYSLLTNNKIWWQSNNRTIILIEYIKYLVSMMEYYFNLYLDYIS